MTQGTTEVVDRTDLSAFGDDQALIWDAQKDMYAGFLAGDRPRIDRTIDPSATIWDAVTEKIARGIEDLNAIRATRPTGAQRRVVTSLEVEDPIIDVSGDLAVSRHVLRVTSTSPAGAQREVMRVSAGWRRVNDRWLVIHSHEDMFSVENIDPDERSRSTT